MFRYLQIHIAADPLFHIPDLDDICKKLYFWCIEISPENLQTYTALHSPFLTLIILKPQPSYSVECALLWIYAPQSQD